MPRPPVYDAAKGWRGYDGQPLLPTDPARAYNPKTGSWGVVLPVKAGPGGGPTPTRAVAPEAGEVISRWTDTRDAPDASTGRAGVMLRGDSGAYHIIGRLQPIGLHQVGRVAEGDDLGRAFGPPGVYWRVQLAPEVPDGKQLGDVAVDPAEWLGDAPEPVTIMPVPTAARASSGNAIVVLIIILILVSTVGGKRR